MIIAPIAWKNDKLYLLDQRILPHEEKVIEYDSIEGAYRGIQDMVVRGAPCIGFTGILGMALWLKHHQDFKFEDVKKASEYLISSRPTAVNLAYEVKRTVDLIEKNIKLGPKAVYDLVVKFGLEQIVLSEKRNILMASFAIEELINRYPGKKVNLMTHCNTGYLACGSVGTALGVISQLNKKQLVNHVYADETRPYMQGSRLTSYELTKEKIPHDIVVEGAASFLMREGKIDGIYVGADRIVANGDTANKVGTSTLAIVANFYKIPFYVVAPVSTFDMATKTGAGIEIEMRDQNEILEFKGQRVAPLGATAVNPSFDVTEGKLISGIICEKGFISAPYEKNIPEILAKPEVF